LTTGFAYSQKLSDPALKPYVELWQNDGVDSLRSVLSALTKKYPKEPEVLFFQAVFEADAVKASTVYESILKDHKDNVLADESLFRLVQFDYAVGKYKPAQVKAERLKKDYPKSLFVMRAEKMFAGLNQEIKIEEKALGSGSATPAEKKFHLQVGAFSQTANAEELRDKLKTAGYTQIEFSEKIVNDKKLILVWVGAFASKGEAAKTGDVLKSKFKLTYTIVEK
jgi:hypothetical protein